MNKYKYLLSNTILLTISNISSKLLSFLLLPLYTHLLSPGDYGVISLITSSTQLFFPLLTLGISEAVIRYTLDKNANKKQIFSIGILTSIISFIPILFFRFFIHEGNVLHGYYDYFIAFYLSYSLNTIFVLFTRGLEKIKVVAINGFLITFLTITLNIYFLIYLDLGVFGYLLSYTLANLISCLYLFFASNLYNFFTVKRIDITMLKIMIIYSLPMGLNAISWWINNTSDRYLVTYFLGIDQAGLYSVAYKIPSLLMVFSTIFTQAWQISSVKEYEKKDYSRFYSNIYNSFNEFLVLVSSMVLTILPFAILVLNERYYSVINIIPILLIAFMYNSLVSFYGTIYSTAKRTKDVLKTTILGASINLILNIILIPIVGVIGAALSTLISYFVIWKSRSIKVNNIVNIQTNKSRNLILHSLVLVQAMLITFNIVYFRYLNIIILILIFIFIARKLFKNIQSILKNTK